jgi:hypothetical protein
MPPSPPFNTLQGSIPESEDNNIQHHPLITFKMHAVQTNEIFLLVADWIGAVMCRYYHRLKDYKEHSVCDDATEKKEYDRKEVIEVRRVTKHVDQSSSSLLLNDTKAYGSHEAFLKRDTRLLMLEHVLEPFTDFTMNFWWDTYPSNPDKDDIKCLCQTSSQLLKESLLLKRQELSDDTFWKVSIEDCVDIFCSSNGFGRIIGSFEQNAIGVRARNPLCNDIFDVQLRERNHNAVVRCFMKAGFIGTNDDETLNDHCNTVKENVEIKNDTDKDAGIISTKVIETERDDHDHTSDSSSACQSIVDYSVDDISGILHQLYVSPQCNVEDDEHPLDGDDLDHIFAPFDGTAMFRVACKMNHSCKPNVIVRYAAAGWYHPLTLECIALREIQKDEELCISYIDFTFNSLVMDVQDRWNQLESYGFKCNCERCLLELQK